MTDRDRTGAASERLDDSGHEFVNDVMTVLRDLQPAAIIVALVTLVAIISGMSLPQAGPWVSLAALAGVTLYVGHRVMTVQDRPAWLLPLALAGLLAAVGAGYRLWRAAHARSNNDRTIGYVFPTAMAIFALWLSVALIEFDATNLTSALR